MICPICGGDDCQETGTDSWQCRNPECNILFGKTKHADGCQEQYEWTRPFLNIDKKVVAVQHPMDLLLRKENVFDRLVITDFDFSEDVDGTIRYVPICPKCGKQIKE